MGEVLHGEICKDNIKKYEGGVPVVLKRKQLENLKKKLIENLKKNLKVEKIILYGSYASFRPHKWSDFDFAVIASDFQDKDVIERLNLIDGAVDKIKKPFPLDLEYFGYSPQEYKNASKLTFLGEIKKTGKVIFST